MVRSTYSEIVISTSPSLSAIILVGGKADNDSVPSDAKYAFKDYDAIMANLPQVAESLNVGAQAMANQIANQIRREIKQTERTD